MIEHPLSEHRVLIKLCAEARDEIVRTYGLPYTKSQLARKWGISRSTVENVLRAAIGGTRLYPQKSHPRRADRRVPADVQAKAQALQRALDRT